MRKLLFSALLIALAAVLVACGGDTSKQTDDSSSDTEDKTLKIGATAGPFSDMVTKAIKPGLEEKGYEVKVTEFSDYIQPNNALSDGALDANLFQHLLYLENFAEENNMDLTDIINVPSIPLGIFSEKYTSLDDIEEGATLTMPNDPVNAARTLITLQDLGLIEIDGEIDSLKASEKDVKVNHKNLKLQPIEAGQLPRSVEGVDLAAIPGNFYVGAGMNILDALALEKMSDELKNVVAVRAEDQDAQFAKDIIEVIESEAFEKVIDEEFKGFEKPQWMEER